jgi:hypothetical protein
VIPYGSQTRHLTDVEYVPFNSSSSSSSARQYERLCWRYQVSHAGTSDRGFQCACMLSMALLPGALAHHGAPPGRVGRALHGGPGRAVQIDPIKPTLKAPSTKRLKLKCNEPLSKFAFKIQLAPLQPGARRFGVHHPAAWRRRHPHPVRLPHPPRLCRGQRGQPHGWGRPPRMLLAMS